MGRPPLAVGTYGKISTKRDADGWRARAYCRDYDGKRREVSRWATTKAAAERAVKEAMNDRTGVAAGGGDFTPDTRIRVVAERWLAEVDANDDLAANTRELYRRAVESYVTPSVGGLRLREATVPALDRALRAVREQHGPGAAKTARSVLSGLLGLAVRHGAIPSNPVRDTSPVAGAARTVRALTVDEQERIQDAPRTMQRAVDLDLPDLIDWMLGTGMRIGEACAIRDEVLDLEAGTVEINATVVRVAGTGLVIQRRPKSAAGWRVLALPDDLVLMLKRRREELRLPGPEVVGVLDERNRLGELRNPGVVFTSPTGKLRDPSNTQGDLRSLLDAIDRHDGPDGEPVSPFGWVTSHTFRKTVATRLDDAGLSARQIADVLGHRKPSMTQDVYMGRKVVSADAARILARPALAVAR